MNEAFNIWKWIENTELKYGINKIPIPDKFCDILLKNIDIILPDLKQCAPKKYKGMLNNDFIIKFETKLKIDKDRSMLFDFIKNLIHEVLLNKERKDLYY